MTYDETVSAAYDRWSSTYDNDANATRDLDAAVLRSSEIPVAGHRVLELGAGTGKNTAWLAAHATQVTALDFSEGMLERARRNVTAGHVQFIQCDLRHHWPVDDASVDLVVGNLVLEHLADLDHVFREIYRVLEPGGAAYVAELHPARQERGGQAQFTDLATGERVRVTAYAHTVEEFRSAALAAGLRVERMTDHLEPTAPTGVPPRLLAMRFSKPPTA